MIIGVPKEIKNNEFRVALLPEAVGHLVKAGHRVLVQKGAGVGAGFLDQEYRESGAAIVPNARRLYGQSEMVVKVKEPVPKEFSFLRPDLRIFCFLHLAPNPRLTRALVKSRCCALAFETLEDFSGRTPLLMPMSEIAGRLSVTLGGHYLQKNHGGRGVLLSRTHFSPPGKVVVVGGGSVGRAAAEVAWGLTAKVSLFDIRLDHLQEWVKRYPGIELKLSTPEALTTAMREADLVVGAVYVHGAQTPKLITRKMVQGMPKGSVMMDVAIDQGGVAETSRPTTISDPIYVRYGVIHCAVTNMPALVSRTASQALSKALLPYVLRLADIEDPQKIQDDFELKTALNVCGGEIIHPRIQIQSRDRT